MLYWLGQLPLAPAGSDIIVAFSVSKILLA